MKTTRLITLLALLAVSAGWGSADALAQSYNQLDDDGFTVRDDPSDPRNIGRNQNFNKHNNDTTRNREVPKGVYEWTIDSHFGDIQPATPDTALHLFPLTIFNTGRQGQYNTTGNNYTARLNRIVIDRPLTSQSLFDQPYGHIVKDLDDFHFTNTLSPITDLTYDNCGDKTNGEDHIDARFATNFGKRLGVGFDLDYSYARGYYQNQSASHFAGTVYASYIGDKYKLHALFRRYHQKAAENGGITNDKYITTPESFEEQFATNEIPTVLQENWNRNDRTQLFLSHRYCLGFYKRVPLTEEEIKARKFAAEAKTDKRKRDEKKADEESEESGKPKEKLTARPEGRPDDAKIAGDEPLPLAKQATDSIKTVADSIALAIEKARTDSIVAAKALQDSLDATTKLIYVPVTSFIHTLDINTQDHIYQAYQTPKDYYANTYWDAADGHIYDETKYKSIKNTFAIELTEGFNRWAKAGLKAFASYDLRTFRLPSMDETGLGEAKTNENSISVGGKLSKTQGHTLHYTLLGETWLAGPDAGQLKFDFATDVNFPLWGDTVTLAAKAYFYRLQPTYYQRHYHGQHIWWDREGLSAETRTRAEGLFQYRKTGTKLRVAIEEIQNYTYFSMAYNATGEGRSALTAGINQTSANINLLTLQLIQDVQWGPLYWDNVITYQNSSQQEMLPVPTLNIFTNLSLRFRLAKVLTVELGADATFFTKYTAPDFCPQINQFAIQENKASQVELGGYPFVDIYANMRLKNCRFFIMYSHVNSGKGNRMAFLAPHYPANESIMRMGLCWRFFN